MSQILFLATVAIHLVFASELDHRPTAAFWIISGFGVWTLIALGWLNAEFAFRNEAASNRPIAISLFIMAGLGGAIGLFRRGLARRQHLLWCLICGTGIGAAFLGANTFTEVRFGTAVRVGGTDPARIWWDPIDWTWTSPAVVIPLMLLGMLMAVARGWRQARSNQAPVAWLLVLAAILFFISLLPTPANIPRPIGLYWTSIALSVYGVFDLFARVVKTLVLEGPEAAPQG